MYRPCACFLRGQAEKAIQIPADTPWLALLYNGACALWIEGLCGFRACGDRLLPSRQHPRPRLSIGVVLLNRFRLALLVEKPLADPRRVPQAFTGLRVFRDMRHHLHGAAAGEPVERRTRRVEPAVEAVEPFQQARWEFVLDAAAGDLPELGACVAMADQHFIDERIVYVAREDDVVTRRAGVAEDIQDHLGGAA